jgi:class 3 adenylate cyclase
MQQQSPGGHKTLASYLPALHLERLGGAQQGPSVEGLHGAVLLVDVRGFTRLTLRYAGKGKRGAELLSEVLNDSFGGLIDVIAEHGGDVLSFAGDALLAVWPCKEDRLEEAVVQAAQAGLKVHGAQGHPDEPLELRSSVGVGPLQLFHVGGAEGRWMLLATGEPLAQVGQADKTCQAGEVVLSLEAWAKVQDRCSGELRGTAVKLHEIKKPVPPPGAGPLPSSDVDLQPFVPEVIYGRRGQADFLAEFRPRMTILFVNLSDIAPEGQGALDRIQVAAHLMQEELTRFEGAVYQFLTDDKGTTLLGACGLPGMAHEDDAVRGCLAAQSIRERLQAEGIASAVGVATGRLFSGSYGNDRRRSFALVGTTMNLAARLMQASEGDGLLVCPTTREAAISRFDFEQLEPVTVKGIDEPVQVYRPLGIHGRQHGSGDTLIGRAAERAYLDTVLDGSGPRVTVFEGEAGIGKSQLLRYAVSLAEAQDVMVLEGAADSIETDNSWFMWRPVLSELLELDQGQERAQARLLELIGDDETQRKWAPVFEDIVPLGLEGNEISAAMSGPARADAVRTLLVQILRNAGREHTLILRVEDAHWLDSASWGGLLQVARSVDTLRILVSTRPPSDPVPAEHSALIEIEDCERRVLGALSPEEAEQLVCHRLEVDSLPPSVAALLARQAEGHPLFTEELAWSLVEQGALEIRGGQAVLAMGADDLAAQSFPDSVQGVITSRIDRLPPETQLILKVASVIGRVFQLEILSAVNPVTEDVERLQQETDDLVRHDLTLVEKPEPDPAWIFKHALIQDVAYNLLAFRQRHKLHKAVAQWYEAQFEHNLAGYYPVLAHHYALAEDEPKALEYLDLAGTRALRNGASGEAVSFFLRALDLGKDQEALASPQTRLRQARWWRSLGLAYYGLGRRLESREAMLRTMEIAGYPFATSTFGQLLQLSREYVYQATLLAAPGLLLDKDETGRLLAAEAADAAQYVSTSYYFDKENLPMFVAALSCATLSTRSGNTREAAVGFSYVGVLVGLFNIAPLLDAYFDRGLEAANAIGDPWAVARHWQLRAMQYAGRGIWVEQELEDSIEFFRRTGDRHEYEISLTVKMLIRSYRGFYGEWLQLCGRLADSARGHSAQHLFWANNKMSEVLLLTGEAEAALPYAEEALRIHETDPEPPSWASTMMIQGCVKWQMGDLEAGVATVEPGLDLLVEAPTNTHGGLTAYQAAGELVMHYLEVSAGTPKHAHAKNLAARFTKMMFVFSLVFPFAKGARQAWQARQAIALGNATKGRKLAIKAIAWGSEKGLPLTQGLGHYHLGLSHPPGSSERKAALEQALSVFEGIGARYYSGHVRGALGGDG